MGYNETLDQWSQILSTLETDYIDLLLIHWPGPSENSTDPACVGPNATPKVGRHAWEKGARSSASGFRPIFSVLIATSAFFLQGLPPVNVARCGIHIWDGQRPRNWRVEF
jgi:hypothetical protein